MIKLTAIVMCTGLIITASGTAIADDGKGFDPDKPTERNGIKNIYARSKSLNGKIKLITETGKGTKWELSFPN